MSYRQPAQANNLPPEAAALIEGMRGADFVLLGELHDHPEQHRVRLQWLRLLAESQSIALVLEHFDSDQQPGIDAARRGPENDEPLPERAHRLAKAGRFSFEGWDWALISPVVEFALQRGIALYAANLNARETFAIARGQPHALSGAIPRQWGAQAESIMSELIREGHCNLLPDPMIPAMVRAQRARDARMAQVMLDARAATGAKPVLLAGNGHVRRDVGVPLHLRSEAPGSKIFSVGLLELGTEDPAGAFDARWITARHDRPDPCEALRQRFSGKKPS
jgi:uncharacterized iron-regulated protein